MSAFYGRARIVIASVAALAVVCLGLGLGLWQLRRAEEKAALQSAQDRAATAPPIELGALRMGAGGAGAGGAAATLPAPTAIDGERVQASGLLDPRRSIFLDNRTREGIAGFHVLTPLKITGRDEHVMVLRGWVARDPNDRSRLPDIYTPTEPVTVVGLAVANLQQPIMLGEEPVPGPADRLWQHFDYRKFSTWAGFDVHPVILRQTVEPGYRDGLARDWNQPGLSVDRHRGYAFQWFAMTAAALVTWLIVLWRFKADDDVDGVGQVAGR